MKNALIIFIFLLSQSAVAKDTEQEYPPLDPTFMGVHGMALITHESRIYAYLLSTYKQPNNVQLLYKLDNQSLALLQAVRDSNYTTIKTKPFNLQRLMRGEKVVIHADLYAGHFDRDGMLVYENIPLTFYKKLYLRTFEDIKPSSTQREYDVVSIRGNYKLYIHKVQKQPSFAQVLGINLTSSCLNAFNSSSPVPKEKELQYKFINCGSIKPFFFESEDFKAAS